MKSSVIADVVRHDSSLCIGCGLCAALCPQESLQMVWNIHGEYNPIESTLCTLECGLCLRVCPFAEHEKNEDTIGKELYCGIPGIKHLSETGYYLASYVGYSEKNRSSSASGGVATWLLERMLKDDIVDYVICIAPTGNPERLFSFKIFDTPEGVRGGAGSAYYPVEMSGVIKQVIETPGRYAITGLPCFIKAIRLAQQRNIKLRTRVVITIGLVCGQLKSKHFTDYIADIAGAQGKVTGVRYRGKSQDHPTSNLCYAFKTESGDERKIFWKDGIAEAWMNRWFTPNACNYCDDIFAECADVAFMDAWLPEYSNDRNGTSLVLVRSPLVKEVIERGIGAYLDSIPVKRVVQSQKGVIAVKRRHMSYRLYLDQSARQKAPKKRMAPGRPMNPLLRQEVVLKDRMSTMSRDAWTAGMNRGERLRNVMQPDIRRLRAIKKIAEIISFPMEALRFIRTKAKSNHHE